MCMWVAVRQGGCVTCELQHWAAGLQLWLWLSLWLCDMRVYGCEIVCLCAM